MSEMAKRVAAKFEFADPTEKLKEGSKVKLVASSPGLDIHLEGTFKRRGDKIMIKEGKGFAYVSYDPTEIKKFEQTKDRLNVKLDSPVKEVVLTSPELKK